MRPEIELLLILGESEGRGRPWIRATELRRQLETRCGWRWGVGNLLARTGGRALFLSRGGTNGMEWSLSAAGQLRAKNEQRKQRLKALRA